MVNVPKHCWNLDHSAFIIFIRHWSVSCVRKSLSYWHAKSWDCLLTRWLLMKSDNLTIRIQMQFYQKQKTFSLFLLLFWILAEVFDVLNKKITLIDFVFSKLHSSKRWSDKCVKSLVSEDAWRSSMVNVRKHCLNLHQITFIIFIDNCQVNWIGKSRSYWHAKSWDCLLTHYLPKKSILFLTETI